MNLIINHTSNPAQKPTHGAFNSLFFCKGIVYLFILRFWSLFSGKEVCESDDGCVFHCFHKIYGSCKKIHYRFKFRVNGERLFIDFFFVYKIKERIMFFGERSISIASESFETDNANGLWKVYDQAEHDKSRKAQSCRK